MAIALLVRMNRSKCLRRPWGLFQFSPLPQSSVSQSSHLFQRTEASDYHSLLFSLQESHQVLSISIIVSRQSCQCSHQDNTILCTLHRPTYARLTSLSCIVLAMLVHHLISRSRFGMKCNPGLIAFVIDWPRGRRHFW